MHQVTLIGRIHEFTHDTQAVYGLAHGGIFHGAGPVAMVHPAVVPEKANINILSFLRNMLDIDHHQVIAIYQTEEPP